MTSNTVNAAVNNTQIAERTKAVLCPSLIWVTGLPLFKAAEAPDETVFDRDYLLRATARLGLPIYFILLPDAPLYAMEPAHIQQVHKSETEGIIIKTPNNLVLHHLSTKTTRPPEVVAHGPMLGGYGFVTDDLTGHLSLEDNPTPNILLVRADGKDLLPEHVEALWSYVDQHLKDTSTHFADQLTPEKFIRFWESLANGKECPVKRGCKACGREVAGLMSCGVCEVVKYCSRECQQGDGETHEKVCVRKYAP